MKRVLKSTLSIVLALTMVLSSASVGLSEVDFKDVFKIEVNAAGTLDESDETSAIYKQEWSVSSPVSDGDGRFSVDVYLKTNYPTSSIQFEIENTNEAALSFEQVTLGDAVPLYYGAEIIYNESSSLCCIVPGDISEDTSYSSIEGVIATITYKVLCKNNVQINIKNDPCTLENRSGTLIAARVDNLANSDVYLGQTVIIGEAVSLGSSEHNYQYTKDYDTNTKTGVCSVCGDTITVDMVSADYLAFELNEDGESYCVTDFYYSTTFTKIEIPDTYNDLPVTSIGAKSFLECAFTQITIPDSVTNIGDYAFLYCPSLTEINVVEGNPNYCSENGVLFNKDKTTLIQYPMGKKDKSYSITDSVTNIGEMAFGYCTSLTSIVIPDSVTSIGSEAFFMCVSLTSITIPNSVTSVGSEAFCSCVSLTSINIPDSVTSIGEYAFVGCFNLTYAIIPDSVTYIGEEAFYYCYCLNDVFYSGTEAEWNSLTSQTEGIIPSSTTVHFNDYEHNCSGELGWVTEKQFTCTENGIVSLECSDCSQVLESVEIQAACVLKYFEITSEYVEEYEGLSMVEPTCKSDGSISSVCEVCGKDATREIPASDDWHSYNYDEWIVDVEPTCGASGSKSYHCEYCDAKTNITEIEPTGEHTYSTEWTIDKEATCVEEGSKSHHCLYCEAKSDVTVIEATGEHTYGDWELTIKPTCEEYGEAERTCTVCGDIQNSMDYDGELDIIEPLGHTYTGDLIVTLKPTCTEEGEGYRECDTCGSEGLEFVAKTGHTFDEWEVVRTSCLEDGYSKRVCSCCGAVQIKDTDGKIILDESYITYDSGSGAYIVSVGYPGAESIEITFGDISGTSDIFIIFYEDGSYQQVDVADYSYSTYTFTGDYIAFGVSALFSSCCIEIESAVAYTEPEENLEATGHNYVIDSYDADHPHTKVYKCSYCGETKTETATFLNCLECNFTFTALDVSSYKVISYIGTGSAAVIPGEYNNCTVTTIANGCFKGNTTITSVEIGNGVTTIGSLAFMNCTSLERVIIPASVTSIGANAFYGFTGTIYCFNGSTAHQYAIDNSIPYVLMSFSGKGTTKVDYVDFLVRTSIQCCDDLTELFEMSDSVLAVPMASYVYGNLELYGTGTVITVFDGDTYVGDFTLIVEGDTNGDSVCDVLDCAQIALVTNGHTTLDGAYAEAADSNSDDIIDVNDYSAIVNTALAS